MPASFPKASPTLPPGWYLSGIDGKSYAQCLEVSGGVVRANRDVLPDTILFEESASLTSPVLMDSIPEELTHCATQLAQLNSTLPALRLPDVVIPFLVFACSLTMEDIRKAIHPLESLSKASGGDQKEVLPAFALVHAMKKVFPTPRHQHLPPPVLGALLTTFVRGALPHTAGGSGGASLFHVVSLIKRGSHNTVYEPFKVDGTIRVRVRSVGRVGRGEALRFPDQATLWEDVLSLCQCGCAAPYVPSYNPSAGPVSTAKKLHFATTEPKGIIKTVLPGRGDASGRIAFTLDNVFSPEECTALSDMAFGSWDSTLEYKQMLKTGPKGNYRLLKSGSDVQDSLWGRIKEYCPGVWQGRDAGEVNERMRFIQYDKGERFVAHTDGEYAIKEGSRAGYKSFITVQVYLTEGMEGGTTRFLNGDATICDSVPKVGRVLVFEHTMRHTGEEVRNDVVKRIIRTEIMYKPLEETVQRQM